MTHRQDDPAPAGGADIIPFRRPETSPVPVSAPHGEDDSDDDGPSAA